MSRKEAFLAGFENPLIGANAPLQRLYGTVQALGEEFSGADMGTPVGTRFFDRQNATKLNVKKLQNLRERYPEEFGQGQMYAQDQMDPYMLGLGTGSVAAMRPMVGGGMPPQYSGPREMPPLYNPPRPYVPMTTAPNRFEENMVLATRRGSPSPTMGIHDEMPFGEIPQGQRYTGQPTPMGKFDQNMYDAYRAGRVNYGNNRRPPPMGGDYTLEELGQAMVPYRENGLVYEPVGYAPQGSANLPAMASRGMIDGEFREIPGIGYTGNRALPPGGQLNFGVTRNAQPSETMPYGKAAAIGIPGVMAALYGIDARDSEMPAQAGRRVELPPIDVRVRQPLQGQAPARSPLYGPEKEVRRSATKPAARSKLAPRSKSSQQLPQEGDGFEPNFNYYVTQMIDQMLGQNEAERGRDYQMRMERGY